MTDAKQRSFMKERSLPVDIRDAVEETSPSLDAHDSDMEQLLITAEKRNELNMLLSYLDKHKSYRHEQDRTKLVSPTRHG
jgi:hypothetical protein